MSKSKKVHIRMLGGFHIFKDGVACDEKIRKTKKGRLLLQYLILQNGRSVPYFELYEALWSNDKSSNPENALKTLVSRTRMLLSAIDKDLAALIGTGRGTYHFKAISICEVDIYEFEKRCDKLLEIDELAPELHGRYAQVLAYYSGDLLPDIAGEIWAIPRSIDLHNRYMQIVYKYTESLKKIENFDEVIRVSRKALDIDAFDEKLHLAWMDALVQSGRNNEALMHYKHVKRMYYRHLGTQLPEGIQEFYKHIITASNVLEMNIDTIRHDLMDSGDISGVFVCEYVVFKEIYKLQVRSIERLGLTMFIALIKVDSIDGKVLESLKMNAAMTRLLDVLKSILQEGDVIAQSSTSQYALLLSSADCAMCKLLMERIQKTFYQKQVNSNIMLTYRLGPIGNIETAQSEK